MRFGSTSSPQQIGVLAQDCWSVLEAVMNSIPSKLKLGDAQVPPPSFFNGFPSHPAWVGLSRRQGFSTGWKEATFHEHFLRWICFAPLLEHVARNCRGENLFGAGDMAIGARSLERRVFTGGSSSLEIESSRPAGVSRDEMRDNVDPFLIPAQNARPDFIGLIGFDLLSKHALHTTQDHQRGVVGRSV